MVLPRTLADPFSPARFLGAGTDKQATVTEPLLCKTGASSPFVCGVGNDR